MPIPLPVLDDLTFDRLMGEARALIPRYAPLWTDHNVSDPGIMLLELFAWLSGTFMFRADQVTDKHIESFLRFTGQDKTGAQTVQSSFPQRPPEGGYRGRLRISGHETDEFDPVGPGGPRGGGCQPQPGSRGKSRNRTARPYIRFNIPKPPHNHGTL